MLPVSFPSPKHACILSLSLFLDDEIAKNSYYLYTYIVYMRHNYKCIGRIKVTDPDAGRRHAEPVVREEGKVFDEGLKFKMCYIRCHMRCCMCV